MKKILFVACLVALTIPDAGAQDKLPLKLVATTPLPGYTGDLDHFGLDLKGDRLFLASEDHKTIEVFDLHTGQRIHSIEGFSHPLTMVYLPGADRLFVTDADATGGLDVVDCKAYKIIKTIKLGSDVDHSAYNPANKYIYVENGSGENGKSHTLSIIDTNSLKQVGEIPEISGGSNEGMAIDHAGRKLYVNMTGSNEVGVIDLKTLEIVQRWPIPDADVAHAIALDEPHRRLFTATRKPPKFIVFNLDTGKVVASLPCVGLNSDMSLDVMHKRIYVTGNDTISVFEQRDADHYQHLAEVPSAYRAKSSIFVPQLGRLYVADSGKGKPDAKLALQIFETQ